MRRTHLTPPMGGIHPQFKITRRAALAAAFAAPALPAAPALAFEAAPVDPVPVPSSSSAPSFWEWFQRLRIAKRAAAVEVSRGWLDIRARYGSLDAAPISLLHGLDQSAHLRHVVPVWTELPDAALPATGIDLHALLDELEAASAGRLDRPETPESVLFGVLRKTLAQLSVGPLPKCDDV